MTTELQSALNFAADYVMTASPEQVILACASSLTTVLAWVGVRLSPRVAAAVGSAGYAGLHAIGVIAKKVEPSPACRAALEALEDDAAMYEGAQPGCYSQLVCTGLQVVFDPRDEVHQVWAGQANLAHVLPGGKDGREWKSVVKRASLRVKEVVERDRVQANEQAAGLVRTAQERAAKAADADKANTVGGKLLAAMEERMTRDAAVQMTGGGVYLTGTPKTYREVAAAMTGKTQSKPQGMSGQQRK